ncbi:MAG: hypothetical protein IRZ16_04605 [Myxococcaceae bacterium]|nr:hypothetical protein [Myxococcaceae bacterium]
MKRPGVLLLGILAVLAGGTASAARVSVLPFTGPRANIPRNQIADAVCALQTCVSASKVTRRGRPDWKKVRREDVDVVLTAAVKGPKAKRVLWVDAFDRRGRRLWQEKLPLARNGMLSRRNLRTLTAHFVQEEEEQPPEVTRREEPPQPPPEPPPEPPKEEEKPRVVEEPAPPPREMEQAEEEPEPAHRRRPSRPTIVAAAGADFVHRSYQYTDLRAPNLRSYETQPVFFAPRVHLELYPLRPIFSGVPGGLGIEADYAQAVLLRSIDENDVAHDTRVTRLDLAARLNFWPGDQLMLAPIVGYRAATFEVGAAPDGTRLSGMPNIRYGALTAGAEAELDDLGPFVLFARLSYLQLLGLGELGSDAFFPDHGGNAFEAQGGLGYKLLRHLELRVVVHYTRYRLTFRPAEGATFNASGAVDQYTGGAAMLRFSY